MGGFKLKSVGKSLSKLGKSAKKLVKNPVKYISGIPSKVLGIASDVLDVAGLDSLAAELDNWADDYEQVMKVLTGEYHQDAKQVAEAAARVEAAQAKYQAGLDELSANMDRLLAFHEIYKMSAANKMESYMDTEGAEIEKLIEEYKRISAQFEAEYDFIQSMASGSWIEKIVVAGLMIVGGIVNDITQVLSGKGNSQNFKNILKVAVTIIVVIIMVILGFFTAGATWVAAVAAILTIISAVIMLDGMYSQGLLMGAAMSAMDFLFNDLLNLDDRIGSDFNKFDSDHADYAEMVMYIGMAVQISAMIASWGAMSGVNVGQMLGVSAGVSQAVGTFSQLYGVYTAAAAINDVVKANEAYNDLKDELYAKREEIENAINSKYRKSFMKHYKDVAYMLNDQQSVVDNYLWGMSASSMYVDPYGTTPVANMRFIPDDDTRVMSFGFEDMFNYDEMAGGSGYTNKILYG